MELVDNISVQCPDSDQFGDTIERVLREGHNSAPPLTGKPPYRHERTNVARVCRTPAKGAGSSKSSDALKSSNRIESY